MAQLTYTYDASKIAEHGLDQMRFELGDTMVEGGVETCALSDQEYKAVIEAYPRRILNVHPALIPSFCGPGMYGLRPHEAALARGCKVTGATVHFVNEECDGGPILLQKAVDILPGDTPEVLQKRVMEQAEWKLLPKAVAMVCSGEIE